MQSVWLAAVAVLLITFVFSMLGMGGGQLIIPVLFWAGLNFKAEAVPLGLLCGALSATSAASTYIRKGLVNWRVGLPFMVTIVIGPPLGSLVNARLPVKPLIALFALFTASAGVLMLTGWRPKRGQLSATKQWLVGGVGGLSLGFVVGLIGRGGGSFVVPLLYICGLDPKMAAATSAVIVTGSNWSGFLSHLPTAHLSWHQALAVGAAAVIGAQLGSRAMSSRLNDRQVKVIFGVLLLGVAAVLIVKDVLLAPAA